MSRGDVESVEYELKELKRKLEGMSKSTFPGEDKEQQRFLEVVRAWATVPWDALAVGQAARTMTAMLPSLREVCALRCADLWYTQTIHGIFGRVVGICAGYEQAAEQAARKKAEGAALAAKAEEERERKERAERAVEARASVTVETSTPEGEVVRQAAVVLTEEKRGKMREVVQAMQRNIIELEFDLEGIDAGQVQKIQSVMAYQESCRGDDTWIWNAAAWEAANMNLESCQRYWAGMCGRDAPLSNWRLRRECDACIDDMARYRELCGGGGTKDGRPWYKRMLGLKARLDALKELAEG